MSLHMLGADPAVYADKATIERVQRAILALPKEKQLDDFQPLTKAVLTQTNAFGVMGPATKTAVSAFNRAYGWDDGPVISAGTLEALRRPDLQPGYAAKIAALDAQAAKQAAAAAAAQTPAQAAVVKQEAAVTATQALAQAVTSDQKAAVVEAQAQLAQAVTPAEVKAAVDKTQQTVEDIKTEVSKPPATSWLTSRTIVSVLPNYGVLGIGGGVLGLIWWFLNKRSTGLQLGTSFTSSKLLSSGG